MMEADRFIRDKVIGLIICFLCMGLLYVHFMNHPITVSGQSMAPTFSNGELLATTSPDTIERNDIVVFDTSDNFIPHLLIKRVIAIPGDTVLINENGLYVNDKLIKDDFPTMEEYGFAASKITLASDEYFCLGDNRNNSRDSRMLGPIKYEKIKYKVVGELFHQISYDFKNKTLIRNIIENIR